jgi:2-polyprenyl-3-methyl-5-hydroxy-6-metoxy-1,4-benzoquinol methylase
MSRLTESEFWDDEWRKINLKSDVLSESHFYFGKNGIFTEMADYYSKKISGKKVLEIGGGGENYRLLALVKWRGFDATVVDYSPVAIEIVKNLFIKNSQDAEFINADFDNYHVGTKFDLVVHWGVLEHFTDPTPLITKCTSLLNNGGHLLFTMPNMEAIGAKAWRKWAPKNWSKHYHHSDQAVVAAMSQAGLSQVESGHFGMPMVVGSVWETRNAYTSALTGLQRAVSMMTRLFPVLARAGHRRISSERVFHGVKQ